MSLRDVQQAPEYAELIDECLDEVAALVAYREGGMTRRAGYLFISCPASTTPMHFDVEHSFLLQVKGIKHVSVATFEDDPVLRHSELDRYIDGEECDFEAMQKAATTTRLEPGVGVYLPSFVPHWVETEAGVSISFSIPFFTAYTERAESVSRINRRLRRLTSLPGRLACRSASTRRRPRCSDHSKRCGTTQLTEHPDDDSVLRDRLRILSRQKWIVLLAVTAVPLVAVVASRSQQHLYQAFGDGSGQPTERHRAGFESQRRRHRATRPVRGHPGQAGSRWDRREYDGERGQIAGSHRPGAARELERERGSAR